MQENWILRKLSFLNVFENKVNFKRILVMLTISTLLNVFIRVEHIYAATSNNLMIPIILPISVAFVNFMVIFLSALLIQYTWRSKVNYGFAAQYSAIIDLSVAITSCIIFIFNGVELGKTAVVIGYSVLLILVSLVAYAVAHFTLTRDHEKSNEIAVNDDMFDDSFQEEHIDESINNGIENYGKKLFWGILGNLFRAFVVIYTKPFIVIGFGMGIVSLQ